MSENFSESGLMAVKQETKYVVEQTLESPTHEDNLDDTPGDDKAKPYTRTDWKKRYDDLRRYQNKQSDEFKAKEEELKAEIANVRPKYAPPKTKEELEKFKADNPDIYAAAETIAHFSVDEQLKGVQEEIKNLQKDKTRNLREVALTELKTYHPDFEDIKADPVFRDWASDQPRQIQDWLFKGLDAKLTARAIDLFKAEHTQVSDDTKSSSKKDVSGADAVNVKGSTDTTSSSKKIWTKAEIAKLSIAEFETKREELNLAMKEGRIK